MSKKSKKTKLKKKSKTEAKGWSPTGFRNDPQWFQKGHSFSMDDEARSHAAVYSCVNILSQDIARLRVNLFQEEEDGSRTILYGSSIARVLRVPNHYQTRSDLFLNMMQQLLMTGNAYALAERNTVGTVTALYPLPSNSVQPWIVPGTAMVFYSVTAQDITAEMVNKYPENHLVPARDILHIRLDTPTHPLIGVTPLTGCQYAVPQGISIQRDSTSFFQRMSRPSGVLKTPNKLGIDAGKRLKQMWESGMSDNFQGRTAVLDNGMEWQPLTMSAADAQLIDQYQMTVSDIAMVYRVPQFMLGDLTKATFQNVEALQKAFQAGALGFYTEHIEASLDKFFGVPANQAVEFDIERGIIRTEFETRMNGLAKAVQGGLMTVNEGRRYEGRGPVEGGDQTFMQRQNWPIDMLGEDAEPSGGSEPAAEPEPTGDDDKAFKKFMGRVNISPVKTKFCGERT